MRRGTDLASPDTDALRSAIDGLAMGLLTESMLFCLGGNYEKNRHTKYTPGYLVII